MRNIRDEVKRHYGDIANSKGAQGCCGASEDLCCSGISDTSRIYDIENLKDVPLEAINASLGCANPFVFAELKEGEIVLDLGSGGGIDVLASSRYVGETGKVYGLDMTDEMLNLANNNKERMGASNVEFIKGYIENIPLPDASVDVVISNCVINLSEDKEKVMREIYRVLKPGGRLAIADIVLTREVPSELGKAAELWVGCIAGALSVEEYETILKNVGFYNRSIIPEHYYNREVLEDKMTTDIGLTDKEWDRVDGAFAGAFIKANK
ncbi:methyltransferase [Candidatus Syntrophocurvum alkaliphilum]|uniref:Arsenite methyltransferase n=1 Tax=Candidatus Syntrophocurvum alkaliphilum TaxID=2293317 RepID=A0A6I6DJE3_9FIRM|nr:arsenite methyltransferase [Candidatus Syntrophocurvum alkaliphilum]QGU00904.1 methyltransferase [Candidatus Syntrophocurvum alkaliphilum]